MSNPVISTPYANRGVDANGFDTFPVGICAPAVKIGASGSEVDVATLIDNSAAAVLAAIGAAPTVTGLACSVQRMGKFFTLDFTLTNVAVTHTDAGASGSSGSVKIFDFAEGMVTILGARMNLTFLGDALIDSNAGDMAFKVALGTAAADAGDGALTGAEADVCTISGTITLSSKAGALASFPSVAVLTPLDGTGTAKDIYFNESGTAATSDANGVLTVSGTITVAGVFLGDD